MKKKMVSEVLFHTFTISIGSHTSPPPPIPLWENKHDGIWDQMQVQLPLDLWPIGKWEAFLLSGPRWGRVAHRGLLQPWETVKQVFHAAGSTFMLTACRRRASRPVASARRPCSQRRIHTEVLAELILNLYGPSFCLSWLYALSSCVAVGDKMTHL